MSSSSRDPPSGGCPVGMSGVSTPLALAHYENTYDSGFKGAARMGKGGIGVGVFNQHGFVGTRGSVDGCGDSNFMEVPIPDRASDEPLLDYSGKGYAPTSRSKNGYGISDLIYGKSMVARGNPKGAKIGNVGVATSTVSAAERGKGVIDTHYMDVIHDPEEEAARRRAESKKLKRAIAAEAAEAARAADAAPGTRLQYRRPTLLQQREFAGRLKGGTLLECGKIDQFETDEERRCAYDRLCHWCVFNQERCDFESDFDVAAKPASGVDVECVEKWMVTEGDLKWFDNLVKHYQEEFECDPEDQEMSFNSLIYDMKQVARKSMFGQLKAERDLRRNNFKNRYRESSRAWETALINVYNTESSNLGFPGFTVSQVKEMARELRRQYGKGEFSSDQQLHVWYHNFRKRHRLLSTSAKYSSRLSAEVLWRRVHQNWFKFDQAMSEVCKRRESEMERRGTMGPLILVNADETFVMHQYPSGSVVRKRGSHLPHSVLTEEGVKGGCSLLCWQTSNPVFQLPPVLITNFQNPNLMLKRRLRANLEFHFPGSLYYPSGNERRGVSWNDHKIWARCLEMVMDYKKSFNGSSYLILVYDSAPSHSLCHQEDLFRRLSGANILLVRLAGKTTAFSQPLDSEGFLRTLKSRLRLETLEERRHLSEKYCTVSGNVFPLILRETQRDVRYSTLRCWHRLGFSPKFYASRVQGDWKTGSVELSRRLTMLGNEARKQSSMGESLDAFLAGKKRRRLVYEKPDNVKGRPKANSSAKKAASAHTSSRADVLLSDGDPMGSETPIAVNLSIAKATPKEVRPKRRNLRPWRSTTFGIVYRHQ